MERSILSKAVRLGLCLLVATPVLQAQALEPRSEAQLQARMFNIQAGELAPALDQYIRQSGEQLIYRVDDVRGLKTRGAAGTYPSQQALALLLEGTPLKPTRDTSGATALTLASNASGAEWSAQESPAPQAEVTTQGKDPGAVDTQPATASDSSQAEPAQITPSQTGGTAPSGNARTLDTIVVTAQKKVERIQDVPIAVSAFSEKQLDEQKIEGGSELLRSVPNVTFSKGNFATYNFSIRGVGTKAVSVGTDPAVAISFNNTPMIRNRLFEQEYFDVERVEVLRGPQGTLYGRNATGGVVNMITNKPTDAFEGEIKAEGGNYGTRRLRGFVNIPFGDTLALRLAGAGTERDGFDYNTVTKQDVNGRDLWGSRATLQWKPSERFNANLIWERFSEDDNRSRTGKQLCHRDPGPEQFGGADITENLGLRGILSQGCKPGSLYNDGAYGVPNGLSLPYVLAAEMFATVGPYPNFPYTSTIYGTNPLYDGTFFDPYAGITQSRDLRKIATVYDPVFRAKNDVYQLNLDFDLTPELKLVSQSAYTKDDYFSSQDYNRFPSLLPFADSQGYDAKGLGELTPGGYFNDPQLGKQNTMVAADLNRAVSRQWSQELRLQSAFDGPFNFSLGANYMKFEIDEDYYVFNNLFTILSSTVLSVPYQTGVDAICYLSGYNQYGNPQSCAYIDPNPIGSLNGQGHNYFRSINRAAIHSWAIFGEGYWQLKDDLKLTAGLRWTDDRKTAEVYKSQLLLTGPGTDDPRFNQGAGFVSVGYPRSPDINQHWQEPTGRLALDWKPDLSWTDETLIYGSLARGYKAGGANPPQIGADPVRLIIAPQAETFEPEYVNAFEIGMKNTLADKSLQLNGTAFFYDYKGYQVSQIVDRIALNENYDAKVWGAEFEALWQPTANFSMNANLGLLRTRIADGERSIDVMNRTQGNADWVIVKPWIQMASNCIAPRAFVERLGANYEALMHICEGAFAPGGRSDYYGFNYDPATGIYDPNSSTPGDEIHYAGTNGGRGFDADLGGKELPNAPHWTFNLGAQYTWNLNGWDLTARGDYYRQGKSFARVYNTTYDRLKAWDNLNLSLTLDNYERNLTFQFYVKNVFNDAPIVDAFTNSDDSGLTTNVFTLDPRIVGVSIRKGF